MDNDNIGIPIKKTTPECSRKRILQHNKHKRVVAAKKRYWATALPEKPRCIHKTPLLKCTSLTIKELQFVHVRFYEIPSKLNQDAFILKCCHTKLPKKIRRRVQREEGSTVSQKQVSIDYGTPKKAANGLEFVEAHL
ncbi:unnamed protein product [Psylliodes chrysocephalus]|uniref:Uncharacterized protein n=1 Tax=Psylliodes chrysocephalus TaxID=3402493 RepID=A0A9P0DB56_9CUCU|nr:unnamed protein product [Psylliodes chrysocephala]